MRRTGACWIGSAVFAAGCGLVLAGRGATPDASAASLRSPDSSLTDCAFRDVRPCPAPHAGQLSIHGPYVRRSARRIDMRIRFANFGGRIDSGLEGALPRVGRVMSLRVGRSTRIRIVQPDRTMERVGRGALFSALANYDSAPVYVSGRLEDGAHLDDKLVRIRARALTLDLSGGAQANLEARWEVEGLPGWYVLLARGQDSPPTWFGDITDARGRATATVAFIQPASGVVCAAVFRADEEKGEAYQCGPIADSGRRLGPIAPVWRGGRPVSLVRAP